jgi:Lipocalin-like domain
MHAMKSPLSSGILAGVITCTSLLCAQGPSGASSVRKMFVGTWKLVSTREQLRDGRTRPYPDLGEKGSGYLIYTDDGHMCATLMKPDRPNWKNDDEHSTDAEKISAASGFTSYCGRYAIDESSHIMLHYPEVAFRPNYVGTVQKRPYRFEGKRLIFSDTVATGEVQRWTITWERMSDARE